MPAGVAAASAPIPNINIMLRRFISATGARYKARPPKQRKVMENSRIALITGATSGLGQAVACALAEQGMHVLLHGRDRERTANAADQIQASGGSVQTYLADLSSLRETRDLAEQVSAEHPVIHLLINNAGIGPGRPRIASGSSAQMVTSCVSRSITSPRYCWLENSCPLSTPVRRRGSSTSHPPGKHP
ncbi:short chain dehydrogenase family protein [Mycobacterium xenopi 3993]|nr:short chain dehydrogenase family protein [Mycobacterium xenopi 3993]